MVEKEALEESISYWEEKLAVARRAVDYALGQLAVLQARRDEEPKQ